MELIKNREREATLNRGGRKERPLGKIGVGFPLAFVHGISSLVRDQFFTPCPANGVAVALFPSESNSFQSPSRVRAFLRYLRRSVLSTYRLVLITRSRSNRRNAYRGPKRVRRDPTARNSSKKKQHFNGIEDLVVNLRRDFLVSSFYFQSWNLSREC